MLWEGPCCPRGCRNGDSPEPWEFIPVPARGQAGLISCISFVIQESPGGFSLPWTIAPRFEDVSLVWRNKDTFPLWQKKEGPRHTQHSPLEPRAMKGAAGDRLRHVAKAGREIFLNTCSPARETRRKAVPTAVQGDGEAEGARLLKLPQASRGQWRECLCSGSRCLPLPGIRDWLPAWMQPEAGAGLCCSPGPHSGLPKMKICSLSSCLSPPQPCD